MADAIEPPTPKEERFSTKRWLPLPDHTQLPSSEENAARFCTKRWLPLPDHTQLPSSDGSIVESFLEMAQAFMLSSAIRPHLDQLHPDGMYCTGHDNGIYWKLTDPPLKGCKAPDWMYIPGVPQMVNGAYRHSYVLWQEHIPPLVVIEFVSDDGADEHDQTPHTGKYWVYENGIRARYYFIWDVQKDLLEGFHLNHSHYEPMTPNERGRLAIPPMGVELGVWRGLYHGHDTAWIRWFRPDGTMLLTGEEATSQEKQRAEQEKQRADALAAKLRELGVDPNSI